MLLVCVSIALLVAIMQYDALICSNSAAAEAAAESKIAQICKSVLNEIERRLLNKISCSVFVGLRCRRCWYQAAHMCKCFLTEIERRKKTTQQVFENGKEQEKANATKARYQHPNRLVSHSSSSSTTIRSVLAWPFSNKTIANVSNPAPASTRQNPSGGTDAVMQHITIQRKWHQISCEWSCGSLWKKNDGSAMEEFESSSRNSDCKHNRVDPAHSAESQDLGFQRRLNENARHFLITLRSQSTIRKRKIKKWLKV